MEGVQICTMFWWTVYSQRLCLCRHVWKASRHLENDVMSAKKRVASHRTCVFDAGTCVVCNVFALVVLQQVFESSSFLSDAQIKPDHAPHLHAPLRAPRLVCVRLEMRSCLFLNGVADTLNCFRTVSRQTVLPVSANNLLYLLDARLGHFSDPFLDFSALLWGLPVAPAVRQENHVDVTLFQASGHLLDTRAKSSLFSVDGLERLAAGHVSTQAIRCHELTTTIPVSSNQQPGHNKSLACW